MNHWNVLRPLVCYPLLFSIIFPAGCSHNHPPILYERSPHTVAVVIASSRVQSNIQDMPRGKGEGALGGAGAAVGDLWSGCVMAMPWGTNDIAGIIAIVVVIVCAGITPIAGIGGAISGGASASSTRDVESARQGLNQNIPDRDRVVALFEQNLYDPQEKVEGHAFKSGKAFGLLERRPDGDYRNMAAEGVDAVLEVDGLAVALAGKNLESQLSLRACASVKLIDTFDNSILYGANRCDSADSTMSFEAWSANQWAAVKADSIVAFERLANNLAWDIFHGIRKK